MVAFIWKENKNNGRKCSNISVKKYQKSPIFGCRSRWLRLKLEKLRPNMRISEKSVNEISQITWIHMLHPKNSNHLRCNKKWNEVQLRSLQIGMWQRKRHANWMKYFQLNPLLRHPSLRMHSNIVMRVWLIQ